MRSLLALASLAVALAIWTCAGPASAATPVLSTVVLADAGTVFTLTTESEVMVNVTATICDDALTHVSGHRIVRDGTLDAVLQADGINPAVAILADSDREGARASPAVSTIPKNDDALDPASDIAVTLFFASRWNARASPAALV